MQQIIKAVIESGKGSDLLTSLCVGRSEQSLNFYERIEVQYYMKEER
jgi:hypothetical protein